ncbi:MAG: 3-hydroxyacyl-CoA dehydrogenase family protein [Thermodesulfobacteriota bacterium]
MENLERIGILGAGLMGHAIAQLFALHGHLVTIFDADQTTLQTVPHRIRTNLEVYVRLGLVQAPQVDETIGRVTLCADLSEMCADRDLIIEAVSENLALKRKVFADLERLANPTTVLSSNTSAISIGLIAEDLERPERMLGTHFWNPPHVVPCVEVIGGPRTAPEVLEWVWHLLKSVGKEPVWVRKDVPGFLGNRMQHALWREAMSLVELGIASPEDVDRVVKHGFGLRLAFIGPLETADLAGLDLTLDVQEDLLPNLNNSENPSRLMKEMVARENLGVKTGQGFHSWSPERAQSIKAARDEVLLKIIRDVGSGQVSCEGEDAAANVPPFGRSR